LTTLKARKIIWRTPMKSLSKAAPAHRERITSVLIFNVGREIAATASNGKIWKGILQAYRDDGLIIKKKYGKVFWNWPYKHLKQIEVEVPIISAALHQVYMPRRNSNYA
jgi:hypothetical protein